MSFLYGLYSEQEHNRTESSSDIDDRTIHEIYSQPFLKSIMAGVGSIMCSYSALSFHSVKFFSFIAFMLFFRFVHTHTLFYRPGQWNVCVPK